MTTTIKNIKTALTIKDITNEQAYDFFMEDPALAWLGLSDDFLVQLHELKKFDPGPYSTIKGIFLNDVLIMIFKYEHYSPVALNTHYYLSKVFHKSGMFEEVVDFLIAWTKREYPKVLKILVMSPSECKHIPQIVEKYGFKEEGRLVNTVIWRQKICDNVIYGLELK